MLSKSIVRQLTSILGRSRAEATWKEQPPDEGFCDLIVRLFFFLEAPAKVGGLVPVIARTSQSSRYHLSTQAVHKQIQRLPQTTAAKIGEPQSRPQASVPSFPATAADAFV